MAIEFRFCSARELPGLGVGLGSGVLAAALRPPLGKPKAPTLDPNSSVIGIAAALVVSSTGAAKDPVVVDTLAGTPESWLAAAPEWPATMSTPSRVAGAVAGSAPALDPRTGGTEALGTDAAGARAEAIALLPEPSETGAAAAGRARAIRIESPTTRHPPG